MRVALFYFVFIGVTGLTLPYFPRYLHELGFSGTQIANVNSIGPWLLTFVPLLWGFVADKTGRPVLLLKIACVCMALALIPLGAVSSFPGVMGVWLLYAFFLTPIIPLIDSVAIVEARRIGTDFARLRLWGSIGFIVALFAFGYFLQIGGNIQRLPAAAACLAGTVVLCAMLLKQHNAGPHRTPPSFHDARKLVRQPALMWFLLAGMVHQTAMSPYYLFYPIHLEALNMGEPVKYWSIGVGVAAEVTMFQFVRPLLKRYPFLPMIGASFLISAARWYCIPQIDSKIAMVLLQTTHAFSFALCYAGSIAYLESNVAEPVRATGRALYSAISQGLGSVAGHQLAGYMADRFNIGMSFKAAAALEVLALAPLLVSAKFGALRPSKAAVEPFKEAPPVTSEEV